MATTYAVDLFHGAPTTYNNQGTSNVITRGHRITFSRDAIVTSLRAGNVASSGSTLLELRLWRVSDGVLLASGSVTGPSGGSVDAPVSVAVTAVNVTAGVEYMIGHLDSPAIAYGDSIDNTVSHTHVDGTLTLTRLPGLYSQGDGDVMPTSQNTATSLEILLGVGGTHNTAPSAPGAFTDPTSGEVVNTTSTVTFGASTDDDGDSLTYDTDLSVDNGGTWTNIRSAQPETSFTYDFTSQPATTAAKLRARARDTSDATSAYTVGPAFTIEHNTAPNPATWVSPASGSTLHRAISQRLDWDFVDADAGDSQSKYDLRYRITGAASWTTTSSTTTSTYHDFAANALAAGEYEAQVLTYDSTGVAATGWSASLVFTMADAPGAPTITSPTSGSTVATDSGTVAWSVASQTEFQVRKVADNAGVADTATVYYDSGAVVSSTARDHGLTYPVNSRYEHLQVRVKADGLWSSWASIRILVSYTPPAEPTVTLAVVGANIEVTGTHPTPTGSQPTVSSQGVYRRVTSVGGAGERIGTGLAPADVFTDYTPASGVDYEYRVMAIGDNDTSTPSQWVSAADGEAAPTVTVGYEGGY